MIGLKTRISLYHPVFLVTEARDYLVTENDEYLIVEDYDPANFVICTDVVADPAPSWDYGFPGSGPMDLVANTGILTFALDNGISNSAGLAGLYSPGHTNCLADFKRGMPVLVEVTNEDTLVTATRFVGTIFSVRPTSGVAEEQLAEVEVHDWMEFAAAQSVGVIPIALNKRADEAIVLALPNVSTRPLATNLDVGVETFATVFDSDSSKMTIAGLFQKLCRNEGGGRIYQQGDGTLRFENRDRRNTDVTVAFALDGIMTEFEPEHSANNIINRVDVRLFLTKVDTGATTVLYKLQKTFPLSPGQSLTVKAEFRDPLTGQRCSGVDIVDPLESGTHIKFGSVDDKVTNDLIANLSFEQDIGGYLSEITFVNNGGVAGYVNFLEVWGNGIYAYDPLTVTEANYPSIGEIGERLLSIDLEQISNPNTARTMAAFYLATLSKEGDQIESLRFLCNQNSELAGIALTLEPSMRFLVKELLTGVDSLYCVDRLRYEQTGPQLWCDITCSPSPTIDGLWIWDVSHWDDPTDGHWGF